MKILLDMNLSPDWVPLLKKQGWETVHWSEIGKTNAPDHIIMKWALKHDYIVFTHDLDFGSILAINNAKGPSVIQIRTQDITPQHSENTVIRAIQQYTSELESGSLIVIEEDKLRVRILPLLH